MRGEWSCIEQVCSSLALDSIVAKTKVILYKLAAIDVKHLIVPYICPDLSSDQISIERDNFWKPILEGNSLSDFITIGVLGNGSFGAVTMIQDPKTHDTYACNILQAFSWIFHLYTNLSNRFLDKVLFVTT